MSEPVQSAEIEDVLSSIRRLVAGEAARRTGTERSRPARESGAALVEDQAGAESASGAPDDDEDLGTIPFVPGTDAFAFRARAAQRERAAAAAAPEAAEVKPAETLVLMPEDRVAHGPAAEPFSDPDEPDEPAEDTADPEEVADLASGAPAEDETAEAQSIGETTAAETAASDLTAVAPDFEEKEGTPPVPLTSRRKGGAPPWSLRATSGQTPIHTGRDRAASAAEQDPPSREDRLGSLHRMWDSDAEAETPASSDDPIASLARDDAGGAVEDMADTVAPEEQDVAVDASTVSPPTEEPIAGPPSPASSEAAAGPRRRSGFAFDVDLSDPGPVEGRLGHGEPDLTPPPVMVAPEGDAPDGVAAMSGPEASGRAGSGAGSAPRPALADLDEEMLQALVQRIVHEELQGALGERITRNVRKLVRQEIQRSLSTRDFD